MTPRADSGGAFLWWCLAGAGLGLGLLSMLTIGPLVLLATLMLCGVLLWRLEFGWGMAGLLTGAALPFLFVAWLNRDGPGEVCHREATSISCGDQYNPWPFAVVAVALVVGGLVLFGRRNRG